MKNHRSTKKVKVMRMVQLDTKTKTKSSYTQELVFNENDKKWLNSWRRLIHIKGIISKLKSWYTVNIWYCAENLKNEAISFFFNVRSFPIQLNNKISTSEAYKVRCIALIPHQRPKYAKRGILCIVTMERNMQGNSNSLIPSSNLLLHCILCRQIQN